MAWRLSVCGTTEVVWKPRFLCSGLQLICIFWSLVLIFLLTIPHRFSMGFRSGEFAGQSSTPKPWSFKQLLVLLAVLGRCQILLENEINIFQKLLSRKKNEVLQNVLVNGCSDIVFLKTQWTNTSRWHFTPNHHRLWKLNTGLQAFLLMSFSTLPPDSRTLVSKLITKFALIWKEDFGPLGNNQFCLTILIKLRFSRLVLHLFIPHFFLPLNFLLTWLDTALCEQPASLAINVCGLPSLWWCQWLSSGQLSDQQSYPLLCSLVNQTERPYTHTHTHTHTQYVSPELVGFC